MGRQRRAVVPMSREGVADKQDKMFRINIGPAGSVQQKRNPDLKIYSICRFVKALKNLPYKDERSDPNPHQIKCFIN